jgi:hypothetical protein
MMLQVVPLKYGANPNPGKLVRIFFEGFASAGEAGQTNLNKEGIDENTRCNPGWR